MSDLIQIGEPRAEAKAEKPQGSAPRVRKREPGPRPDWLRVKYQRNDTFEALERLKDGLDLVTVCEEARCPNIDECWSAGTASKSAAMTKNTISMTADFANLPPGTPTDTPSA